MNARLTIILLSFLLIASPAAAEWTWNSFTGELDNIGLSSGTADSTYLRLDCSNDPLTGDLELNNSATALNLPGFTTKSVPYIGASGYLSQDNSRLNYDSGTDTLYAWIMSTTALYVSGWTEGWCLYAGASGLMSGENAYTYTAATDTLNVPNITMSGASILADSTASSILTLGGTGGSHNESLTIDFDWGANSIQIGTGSGATLVQSTIDWAFADNIAVKFGNSNDFFLRYKENPTNTSIPQLILAGGANGWFTIVDQADQNNASRFPAAGASDPTLRIYSGDGDEQDDYFDISHNRSNGRINIGNGDLQVNTENDKIIFGNTSDTSIYRSSANNLATDDTFTAIMLIADNDQDALTEIRVVNDNSGVATENTGYTMYDGDTRTWYVERVNNDGGCTQKNIGGTYAIGTETSGDLYLVSASENIYCQNNVDIAKHACMGTSGALSSSIILDMAETFTATTGNVLGLDATTTLSPSAAVSGTLRSYSISFNTYWDSTEDGDNGANQALLYGILGQSVTAGTASGDLARLSGGRFANYHYGSGTVKQMDVVYSLIRNDDATNETGDITDAYNYFATAYTDKGTGTLVDRFGYYYADISGGGNATNQYGLYIEDLTSATNNYAIYLAGSGTDNGILFGTDTNLYRSAANILETDDAFIAKYASFGDEAAIVHTDYGGSGDWLVNIQGTSSNTAASQNIALNMDLRVTPNANTSARYYAAHWDVDYSESYNLTHSSSGLEGIEGRVTLGANAGAAINPTVTSAKGMCARLSLDANFNGTLSIFRGIDSRLSATFNGGTVADYRGLCVGDLSNARITTSYGLYFEGTGTDNDISWMGDTNLYRGAANELKTDDGLEVMGHLSAGPDGYVNPNRILNIIDSTVDTTSDFNGLYLNVTKTAGVTDYDDDFWGFNILAIMNQNGGTIGYLQGCNLVARLTDGNIGDNSNSRNIAGLRAYADMEGGKVWGDAYGLNYVVTQDAGNEVTGDIVGARIKVDADGTVGGSVYAVYLEEGDNVDYGIYQDGTAQNYLGGQLEILNTTDPQLRLTHTDGIDEADFYVNSDGELEVTPTARTLYLGDGTAGDATFGFYGNTSVYTFIHDDSAGTLNLSANDVTNYTQFAADGIMTMAGTARVYKNLFIRPGAVRGVGSNPATETANAAGFTILEFADANDNYARFNINVPSDMDLTADAEIRVTWSVPNTSANMTWGYGYSIAGENEDTEAAATTGNSGAVASSGTADGKTTDVLFTISGNTLANGDLIQVYFYRDVSEDSYGNPVDVHGVAMKYVANKLGVAL